MAVDTTSLCTLQDVKNFLGITGSKDTEDTLIVDLIDGESNHMELYMGRVIVSAEQTEYHDGDGSAYLYPSNYPITSVSGIWDDTDWTWGSSSLLTATNYSSRDDRVIVYKNSVFSKGKQNIKIIYTAGYSTVPEDLKVACMTEVSRKFKRRREAGVESITKEDGTTSYSLVNFLPEVKSVLDRYKKRVIL